MRLSKAVLFAVGLALTPLSSIATSGQPLLNPTLLADLGGELQRSAVCDIDEDGGDELIFAHRWNEPRTFVLPAGTAWILPDTAPAFAPFDDAFPRNTRSLVGESWGEVVVFSLPAGDIMWSAAVPGYINEVGCLALPDATRVYATSLNTQMNRGYTSVFSPSGVFETGTYHPDGVGRATVTEDVNGDGYRDLLLAIETDSTLDVETFGDRVDAIDGSKISLLPPAYIPAVQQFDAGHEVHLPPESTVLLWQSRLNEGPILRNPVQVARLDGEPIVIVLDDVGRVYALDGPSGERVWEWKDASDWPLSYSVLSGNGATDRLVVGGNLNYFELGLQDGTLKWAVPVEGTYHARVQAIGSGFLASGPKRTAAMTADGTLTWEQYHAGVPGGPSWSITSGDVLPAEGDECMALYSAGPGQGAYTPGIILVFSCGSGTPLSEVRIDCVGFRLSLGRSAPDAGRGVFVGDTCGRLFALK